MRSKRFRFFVGENENYVEEVKTGKRRHFDVPGYCTSVVGLDERFYFVCWNNFWVVDGTGQILFDTYHLGQDPDILGRISQLAPHVAIVQLGDARQPPEGEQNRCRLGEGIVPLAEIVGALRAAGYDGYYDVELLGEEIEPSDYESLLEHAKEAFGKLLGIDR